MPRVPKPSRVVKPSQLSCPECGAPRVFGICPFKCGYIRNKTRRDAMKKLLIEIRAAEGGQDAASLVKLQVDVYKRLCARRGL